MRPDSQMCANNAVNRAGQLPESPYSALFDRPIPPYSVLTQLLDRLPLT